METSMNSGKIPITVLNNLNEHCVGGFVLFYFNSESGMPEHCLTFDSPVHSLAMQKYLIDWSDAVREIHIESTKSQIMKQNNIEEDSENEDL